MASHINKNAQILIAEDNVLNQIITTKVLKKNRLKRRHSRNRCGSSVKGHCKRI